MVLGLFLAIALTYSCLGENIEGSEGEKEAGKEGKRERRREETKKEVSERVKRMCVHILYIYITYNINYKNVYLKIALGLITIILKHLVEFLRIFLG